MPIAVAPQVANDEAGEGSLAGQVTSAAEVERSPAPVDNPDAEQQPPIPEDAIWLDVRVVDAERKQPVAGAEVSWITTGALRQPRNLQATSRRDVENDPEVLAAQFGWRTRSDTNGVARIAAAKDGAMVFATTPGRFAIAWVGGDQPIPPQGWVIELEVDRRLQVRVVDALGQPAIGAYVGLRVLDEKGAPRRSDAARRVEGPEASADFGHALAWLRSVGPMFGATISRCRVVAMVPGGEGPHVDLDVAEVPSQPVVLRLPPTGRIAVRLLHEGRVCRDGVSVSAWRGGMMDREPAEVLRVPFDDDGWARLPCVALGGEFVVAAQLGSGAVREVVQAPLGRDQEVRVELSTAALYLLRGQFFGADGRPVTNTAVRAELQCDMVHEHGSFESDEQGRFRWFLDCRLPVVRLGRLQFFQDREGAPAWTVTVPPRELQRGDNDLGVLRLVPAPVIAAGRLQLDATRRDVRVELSVETPDARFATRGEERWTGVPGLSQDVRADGTFEVRGFVEAGRYRLSFPSPQHLPVAPVEFRPGQDDLVVAIPVGNELALTCLGDDAVPPELLRAELVPDFAPPPEFNYQGLLAPTRYQTTARRQVAERCTLRWAGLPSGTYSLQLSLLGLAAPLVRIEGVVLPLPEGGDTRFVDLDLRGKVTMATLTLDGTWGAEGKGVVFPMPQADAQCWHGLMLRRGAGGTQLPVVAGPLDLMVLAQGMRPLALHFDAAQVATGRLAATWPSSPELELRVAGVPELPDGVSLRVMCSPTMPPMVDGRQFVTNGVSGSMSALGMSRPVSADVRGGRAVVTLADGTFHVVASLHATDGRQQRLKNVTPREVRGGDAQPPVTIELSADEIRAALARLTAAPK